MDNALFYTLSTIAQALAAAFSLLGAFVLVKLQMMSQTAVASAAIVVRPYLPNEEARRLVAVGKFTELLEYLGSQQVQRPESIRPHMLAAAQAALEHSVAERSLLLRRLRRAMVATGVAIVLAVVGLALTPMLSASPALAVGVLTCAVVAVAACLALYGHIIWLAASDA